jgi:hypothetical protein
MSAKCLFAAIAISLVLTCVVTKASQTKMKKALSECRPAEALQKVDQARRVAVNFCFFNKF